MIIELYWISKEIPRSYTLKNWSRKSLQPDLQSSQVLRELKAERQSQSWREQLRGRRKTVGPAGTVSAGEGAWETGKYTNSSKLYIRAFRIQPLHIFYPHHSLLVLLSLLTSTLYISYMLKCKNFFLHHSCITQKSKPQGHLWQYPYIAFVNSYIQMNKFYQFYLQNVF